MSEAIVAAAPPASEPVADPASAMEVDPAPPAAENQASTDAQQAAATSSTAAEADGKPSAPATSTAAAPDLPAGEAKEVVVNPDQAEGGAPSQDPTSAPAPQPAQAEEPSTSTASASMGPPAFVAAAAESESASATAAATSSSAPGSGARVYLATYSNVPVYELTVRGIAVMRRRADGFLNATQILKVAGIEKGRRTKILEKEILTGEHEKVQGGYGKYQGTWIPLQRAKELSASYKVAHLLTPVLEFDPSSAQNLTTVPKGKRPNPNAPSAQRLTGSSTSSTPAKVTTLSGRVSRGTPSRGGTPATVTGAAGATAGGSKAGDEQMEEDEEDATPAPLLSFSGAHESASGGSSAANAAAQTSTTIGTMENGGPSSGPLNGGVGGIGASAPSQHPRFLRLRPPPASSSAAPILSAGTTGAINDLPLPNGEAAGAEGSWASRSNDLFTPNKRARLAAADDGLSAADAMRVDSTADSANVLESPVRDLNNLGPAGGNLRAAAGGSRSIPGSASALSSATGAVHSRSARVILGPPDELARDRSGTRYADRAQAFKGADESQERALKEILTNLFLLDQSDEQAQQQQKDGEATGKDDAGDDAEKDYEAQLKPLLAKMSASISLGGASSSGAAAAANNPENPNVSVNVIIDDHGHTPLHWAAALSKISVVRMLLARRPERGGANVHAGNFAGETALHRSVLVNNNYESGDFPDILNLLSESLSTRDYKRRTILHHIAMVAALRGRAASARYYLACVLEHIAQQQRNAQNAIASGARLSAVMSPTGAAALINAQDEDGETALGIVARIGNASMIRMLLDIGARKDIVNHFGIRASDWGIDLYQQQLAQQTGKSSKNLTDGAEKALAEELGASKAGDVVNALVQAPLPPTQKSEDVMKEMHSGLDELKQVFQVELAQKQKSLSAAQAQLKEATRELSNRRSLVAAAQQQVAQREEYRHSIANLKHIIAILQDGILPANESFVQQSLAALQVDGHSPTTELIRLRWLNLWMGNSCQALENRIANIAEESKKKEAQCRKVVAMCCGVEEERVAEILDDLVIAIESDGAGMDLTRVAGFLSKVST